MTRAWAKSVWGKMMVELSDLYGLLQSLADDSSTAKVSFYYVGDDGVGLRNGSIMVDHGVNAYIDHRGLNAQEAVESIRGLKLIKVAELRMNDIQPPAGVSSMPLNELIANLKAPSKTNSPAPPAPAPAASAPAPTASTPAPAASGSAPASAFTTTEIPALSHIDIKSEAMALLQPLFGVSAGKKIDEFAIAHPPSQHPYEFLLLCQKHTAIMLGAGKAEALFRPLYDQLAAERLQRRR